MKNASTCAAKLSKLLQRLGKPAAPEFPDTDDPVAVLVQSFLMWESTTKKAVASYQTLRASVVDFNELRVSLPHELVELIGARSPKELERCQRLRASLNDLYRREHGVRLDRLLDLGKREVKRYVESLEGAVPYVSARLMLLSFETHAIPADDQLRTLLIQEGAADESAELPDIAPWLARQVRASQGPAAHYALQGWVDEAVARIDADAAKSRKKSAAGTSSRKKTPDRDAGTRASKTTRTSSKSTRGK